VGWLGVAVCQFKKKDERKIWGYMGRIGTSACYFWDYKL
jgi:hypothetical protein